MTDEEPTYEVTSLPARKKSIDISSMPAPELTDTRTPETEHEYLLRLLESEEQIEELRDTVRFAAHSPEDYEPTDTDLADVVNFFIDAGWSAFTMIPAPTPTAEEPVDEEEADFNKLMETLLKEND